MTVQFAVQPTATPLDAEARAKVLADPAFGRVFTDHMVSAVWSASEGWHDAKLTAYGPTSIDPAAVVLHYGQTVFEGLKAYRQPDGGGGAVPARAQRRPDGQERAAAGAARAARGRLRGGLQAARRPATASGCRPVTAPRSTCARSPGRPRSASGVRPSETAHVPADRLAGRQLLLRSAATGLAVAVAGVRAGGSRRHRGGQVRRQLRRVAGRAAGGHRERLRPGRVPRRGRAPLARGARRHEHLPGARRRHAGHARRSAARSSRASPATRS